MLLGCLSGFAQSMKALHLHGSELDWETEVRLLPESTLLEYRFSMDEIEGFRGMRFGLLLPETTMEIRAEDLELTWFGPWAALEDASVEVSVEAGGNLVMLTVDSIPVSIAAQKGDMFTLKIPECDPFEAGTSWRNRTTGIVMVENLDAVRMAPTTPPTIYSLEWEHGRLTLPGPPDCPVKWELRSLNGRIPKVAAVHSGAVIRIDVSALPAGIYVMYFLVNGVEDHRKFVRSRQFD
ncbi:MAG: T9SS type A sorting domain-containing protein [Bacteroidota bacterium]